MFTRCKSLGKIFLVFWKNILTATLFRSMLICAGPVMTIRKTIQKELKRRDWSYYRLVKELGGTVPPASVYEYLAGKSDLGSERVSIILHTLELKITSKSNVKRGKRPRKEK